MAGSATLGTNLVDELVPDVVDALRDELHTELGVRQFRAFTVRRTWVDGNIGEGAFTDEEIEITPQPFVESWLRRVSGLHENLEPCGIDEAGLVKLKEVSLTYTEAELNGGELPMGQEWFIKLVDAHGQEIKERYFIVNRPPFPDRINNIGWEIELRRTS